MPPTSIGIIGYGQFGRFIESLAREHFPKLNIHVAHHGDTGALTTACAADYLFLCVPISAYAETARVIAPLLGAHTIVVDVATVKTHTVKALREAGVVRFIATHPMFGPYSYAKQGNSLAGLRIALCDSTLTEDEHVAAVRFLSAAGLKVLVMTADEHDKLIAETLFLTHLVGQTVHQGGFERTSIDTVSFGYLMDAVESVAHDEALFRDVFAFNPYCKDVLQRYEAARAAITASLS